MKTAKLILKYHKGEFDKFGQKDPYKGDKVKTIEITDSIYNLHESLEEEAGKRMDEFDKNLENLPKNALIMQNMHVFDAIDGKTEEEEEEETIVDGYFREKIKEAFGSDTDNSGVIEYLQTEKVDEDIVVVFIDFSKDEPITKDTKFFS